MGHSAGPAGGGGARCQPLLVKVTEPPGQEPGGELSWVLVLKPGKRLLWAL